ncbi:FAD-binding oxidoreductase [Candidatus Latescibacterota bacterium]
MIEKPIIKELIKILGPENVFTGKTERLSYSYDSQHVSAMPDVVVHVSDKYEVAAVVKLASKHNIPVITRGAGSGLTGGSVPEQGGIVLNLERMNKILYLNVEDRIIHAQAGVITGDIQKLAEENGLYYPPEPASAKFSSIGGNVAESAGGLGCVKYGLTKDFVRGLEFVTSDGDIIRTGIYTDNDSTIDVGTLLVGSEGTLGIITEVALALIPLPEKIITILALFRSIVDAADASNAMLSSGAEPSVLEFMDGHCIDTVREYADVDIPADTGALLLIELEGETESVAAGHTIVLDILSGKEPIELKSAQTPAERESLWKLRKSLSPSIAKIAPVKFNEDICVPISQIPRMCAFVEELGKKRKVKVVTFGHSGDGNIHVNFMTHWDKTDELARVEKAIKELFEETVRSGGTLSGEHGIGLSKRGYITLALDKPTIKFEKKIKHAFDPTDILNPGKIFPE